RPNVDRCLRAQMLQQSLLSLILRHIAFADRYDFSHRAAMSRNDVAVAFSNGPQQLRKPAVRLGCGNDPFHPRRPKVVSFTNNSYEGTRTQSHPPEHLCCPGAIVLQRLKPVILDTKIERSGR